MVLIETHPRCMDHPTGPGHLESSARLQAVLDALERMSVEGGGNGTQDPFYADPRVAYMSIHQWPLYPGTGQLEESGEGEAEGTTLNLPALDEVVAPFAAYLEGGYDLDALARGAGACVAAMAGVEHSSEPATSGGPGADVIERARRLRV